MTTAPPSSSNSTFVGLREPPANITHLFFPSLQYGDIFPAKKVEQVALLCLLCCKTLPFQKLQKLLLRGQYSILSSFHTQNRLGRSQQWQLLCCTLVQ